MATRHKLTTKDAELIVNDVEKYIDIMSNAVAKYRTDVLNDIMLMRTFQNDHPDYYAKWCNVSAIMSNGMELNNSFIAAHGIVAIMSIFPDMVVDYDMVNDIVKSVAPSAGSPAYGGSIRAIVKEWHRLATWTPDMMTYHEVRDLQGMGPKTCMWSLALWNHHNHVFTLDRWMLRGIAGLEQAGSVEISELGLTIIAEMMLDIADMLEIPPLVAQWSMWNVYRNDVHADHSNAVPEWYRS